MKAKTIRPIYDYPIGTEGEYDDFDREDYKYGFRPYGSTTVWMVEVGVDIELLDVPAHLFNSHDDIISAAYWADRLLNKTKSIYVFRHKNGSYGIATGKPAKLPVVAEWYPDTQLWEWLETRSNLRLGGDPQWFETEIQKLQEQIDAGYDVKYELESLQKEQDHAQHYLLCSEDDTRHILEDMLYEHVSSYMPDVTNCIVHYLPDSGEFGEVWVTDDSRYFELGTEYWSIR